MDKELMTKVLESILTIDGQGRQAKARMMLKLLEEESFLILLAALKEVGERKFF